MSEASATGGQEFGDVFFQGPSGGATLPPEQTTGELPIVAQNSTRVPCRIDWCETDPWLADYLDLGPLLAEPALGPGSCRTLQALLRNPANPAGPLEGDLRIRVNYEDGKTYLRTVRLVLEPFPDYVGLFALDYGNTNSAFVVLPAGRDLSSPEFAALHLLRDEQLPERPMLEHASAIQFTHINDDREVRDWRVGNPVMMTFRAMVRAGRRDTSSAIAAGSVIPGGIKRHMGRSRDGGPAGRPDASGRLPPPQTAEGRQGRQLDGDELSRMLIEKFVRQSETQRRYKGGNPIGRIRQVIATHPVNFTPVQVDRLREACRRALNVDPRHVITRYDEATAAALYYVISQIHGRPHEFWAKTSRPGDPDDAHGYHLLVFDCGGGTTDIALLRVVTRRLRRTKTADGIHTDNWFEVVPTVLGLTGEKHFAGDNITLEIFRLIRLHLAGMLAELAPRGLHPTEAAWAHEQDRANFADDLAQIAGELRRAGGDTTADAPPDSALFERVEPYARRVIPTDFGADGINQGDPRYLLRRDYFYQLWDLAEEAKRGLSQDDTVDVSFDALPLLEDYRYAADLPGRPQDEPADEGAPPDEETSPAQDGRPRTLRLTREAVDARVARGLRHAWDLARDLCNDLKDAKVDEIVLTGNGSKYPLVAEMLRAVFDDDEVFEYQPRRVRRADADAKLAVVKGAAMAQWYHQFTPRDFDVPDQVVVSFLVNKAPVMPHSIYYQGPDQRPIQLFKRGTPLNPDPAKWEIMSIEAPETLTLFQGLRDQETNREMIAWLQCDILNAPRPEAAPADAPPRVVVAVNCEREVRVYLRWGEGQGAVESKDLPLLAPDPPADSRLNDPTLGLH